MTAGKHADFLGKARRARQKAEVGPACRHRLMSIRVPGLSVEAGPYPIHTEPVWQEGATVRHVTAGDRGFRLGAMVGLAAPERAGGVTKDWIDADGCGVQIAGRMYPAEVQPGPFCDPTGAITRGQPR